MRAAFFLWLPPAGWAAFIFFLSDQPGLPQVLPSALQQAVTVVAHLVEYAVLAALLLRAVRPPHSLPSGGLWLAVWAIAVLYGISDEWHQSFVPHRSAGADDVVVDAVGTLLGLAGGRALRWRAAVQPKLSEAFPQAEEQ